MPKIATITNLTDLNPRGVEVDGWDGYLLFAALKPSIVSIVISYLFLNMYQAEHAAVPAL